MIIKETIYAITGFEGTDGKPYFEKCEKPGGCCGSYYQREVSPEEQKARWASKCLWTEAAIAGFVHSVSIHASLPGTIMNMVLAAMMVESGRNIQKTLKVNSDLRTMGDGVVMGGLLLQAELGGNLRGAAIGVGCAALSKVAFTVANFVRDHAPYLDG